MELETIEYQNVSKGDTLFVRTEKNKKGEPLKVVKVESWDTSSSHLSTCERMFKLTFENGDEWFGWAARTLQKLL